MTIVIMLAIVLMWAIVLIPMWLRRHDDVEESRSLDRFSTAMHTLSRREEALEKKYLVMPHRSREHDVHLSGGAASERPRKSATEIRAEKIAKAAERRSQSGPPSQAAAARRRRTLTGLTVMAVVTLAAWFFVGGTILLALQVISDLALVGFLWSLRGSARTSATAAAPRRRPAPTRAPARRSASARSSRSAQPVRRGESIYDDFGSDMYDDEDWRDAPVPGRVPAAAAPRRQVAQFFDQDALDESPIEAVHDAWLDEPTYDEAPRRTRYADEQRYVEEPQYFDLPRAERVRERQAPAAPPRRQSARAEEPVERVRGRRTVDSRRTSVSDRIASYSRDLEVDAARPSRSPRPAAASDDSIGTRPWEPVPVPRPVYTTKPAAPRRTARAPQPEPLPPVVETAANASPEELEEILDRRWAVND